jgi:hypothetical protein
MRKSYSKNTGSKITGCTRDLKSSCAIGVVRFAVKTG